MALTDKLTAIADAIRAKAGTTEKLTLAQMPAAIAAIQAGSENLLDHAVALQNMFNSVDFGGGKELTVSFGSETNTEANPNALNLAFGYASGLKSVKILFGGAQTPVMYLNTTFRINANDTELETIDLTQLADKVTFGDANQTFYGRKGLKEILGELDCSAATKFSGVWYNCLALEHIRFKAGTVKASLSFSSSPNLTDATIQNIIDSLGDMTGGTAQALTLHATVGAKLTDAQKSAASAKNWTISY